MGAVGDATTRDEVQRGRSACRIHNDKPSAPQNQMHSPDFLEVLPEGPGQKRDRGAQPPLLIMPGADLHLSDSILFVFPKKRGMRSPHKTADRASVRFDSSLLSITSPFSLPNHYIVKHLDPSLIRLRALVSYVPRNGPSQQCGYKSASSIFPPPTLVRSCWTTSVSWIPTSSSGLNDNRLVCRETTVPESTLQLQIHHRKRRLKSFCRHAPITNCCCPLSRPPFHDWIIHDRMRKQRSHCFIRRLEEPDDVSDAVVHGVANVGEFYQSSIHQASRRRVVPGAELHAGFGRAHLLCERQLRILPPGNGRHYRR